MAAITAPAVARLLDAGTQDEIVYLVREYIEGTSARAILERDGPLAATEAARICAGTLEGLAEAHDAGVLHLSLEPDDVIITDDGSVRVTDLGIGAVVWATRTPADAARLLGTDHPSPELLAGAEPDIRADVYGAGALAFELLTGEPPRGRTSPRAIRGDVPRGLDRVVARALAADPAMRFPDVLAFAEALAPADGDPAEPGERSHVWLRSWLVVPALLVIGLAAAAGIGLWLGGLEVGGPLGIRVAGDEPTPTPGAPASVAVRPVGVTVADPFGDGVENDDAAPLATDGDRTTAWRSENYFDGELPKAGVGLIVDLGETRSVEEVRLSTSSPGFTFALAVGDDPGTLVDAVGGTFVAETETRATLVGQGRYVLIWVTSVVPVSDGDRAEIAEVRRHRGRRCVTLRSATRTSSAGSCPATERRSPCWSSGTRSACTTWRCG